VEAIMNELLSKLSSYNLFNYLLPGIIFVVLAKALCGYSFVQEDLVLGAFLYYFIGMVISRFGSVVIEPILKKIKFLKFADYKDFVIASQKDDKIELFSEVNNTYRTLCSMFMILGLLKIYGVIENQISSLKDWYGVGLVVILAAMFLLSYRKQTNYINKRIEANKQ
jgi:hypothetical protein